MIPDCKIIHESRWNGVKFASKKGKNASIRISYPLMMHIHPHQEFLYSVGDWPVLCLKLRLKYFGSVKPQLYATSATVLLVSLSNWQACLIRASRSKSCGVMPMACFSFLCKPLRLTAAADAISPTPASLFEMFSSTNCITRFRTGSNSEN